MKSLPVSLSLSLLLVFAGACASGARPVSFGEMGRPPYLQQDKEGRLLINLSNSNRHSALSISRVAVEILPADGIVLVRGIQSLTSNPRPVFKLDVPRERIMDYRYYWTDPDGRRHLLAFE